MNPYYIHSRSQRTIPILVTESDDENEDGEPNPQDPVFEEPPNDTRNDEEEDIDDTPSPTAESH